MNPRAGFEEINKIDQPLTTLSKKKRERKINKIRNERGEIKQTPKKYKGF